MATTYSTSLKLTLIGDGLESGTWGQTTNTNLGTLLEQAITGYVAIDMADANVTLTDLNGTFDQARNAVIELYGTNNGIRDVIPPVVEKLYTIYNNTTGGYAIRVIGATGTGVTIPSGVTTLVYCNGTNFVSGISGAAGNFTTAGNLVATANVTANNATITNTLSTANIAASNATFVGGTVYVPTAANSTNSTIAASTAFVKNNITALSLGTMSTQNANNVAITGGTISGLGTPLPVASGGTGAAELSQGYALVGNGFASVNAIAPGTAGNVFTSNGSNWVSAAPAGLAVYSSGSLSWSTGASSWNSGKSGIVAFGMNFICINPINGYVVGDIVAGASSDGDAARQTAIARTGSTIYYYVSGTASDYAAPNGGTRASMNPTYWNIQFWVLA